MLDDFSKSVKAQLYERISSPLLASFCLSWAAWNYRFIFALASSMAFTDKIAYIDTHIFPTYERVILHGFIYPLFTALLLIFVYPIPAKYVYEYWRSRQRELKEIQQRIDDETPLSREEARELRREALKASLEHDKEIEKKSAEIARLKELIEELQHDSTSASSPVASSITEPQQMDSNGPDDLQMKMLEKIANAQDGMPKKVLIGQSGDNTVLAEYNLGELQRRELVSENFVTSRRDYILRATHQGRACLVKKAGSQAVPA